MLYEVLLIDDEELARKRLRSLLRSHEHQLSIVGEAENGMDALEKINQLQPNLIFLDIRMPGLSGLELARQLYFQPIIIFTTAYDEYALEAFSTNSIAYLLKPIQQEQLDRALAKLHMLSTTVDRVNKLFEYLQIKKQNDYINCISCQEGTSINLINVDEVCYFQTGKKTTSAFTLKGEFTIEATLASLEQNLDPQKFTRVHRTTIVNYAFIGSLKSNGDGTMELTILDKNSTRIHVSKSYAQTIRIM
ncbi:MAG: response regulator transcription factor [Chitinivibrionales bacterium]|nr:response regulator transcription factor [Chitinivibrionales bacterium]